MPEPKRPIIFRRGHPLATQPDGRVRESRYVLYEKLKGIAGNCHWCDIELTWKTLCADHLDSNTTNNHPENLVASCRGCNANREDGTGRGRRRPKECAECGRPFIGKSHHKDRKYCSYSCTGLAATKRHNPNFK